MLTPNPVVLGYDTCYIQQLNESPACPGADPNSLDLYATPVCNLGSSGTQKSEGFH